MKTEYIRNLNVSHLVIEQKAELRDWEKEMVAQNHIEGLLFAESVNENNTQRLWYDITGKQALEVLLETSELDHELLCMLMERIYQAVEQLQAFLLKEDDMLLSPEYIFLDHQSGKFFFCYYPGYEQSLHMAFARLTEYLLTKLNHTDEKAVKLAYDLYEQTRKEGYSLSAMRRMICAAYPKETEVIEETGTENRLEQSGKKIERLETEKGVTEKGITVKGVTEKGNGQKESGSKNGTKLQMKSNVLSKERIAGMFIGRSGMLEQLKTLLPVELMESIRKRKKGKTVKQEPFVFEPEEDTDKPAHPTVLLSEIAKEPVGILRCEGNSGQDLKINKIPFLIGSDENCEGYIKSSTVSRKHAKITKTGDVYFIEDLNSSNGTYVGGELLNYRIKMSLQKNESIVFANEKFTFI